MVYLKFKFNCVSVFLFSKSDNCIPARSPRWVQALSQVTFITPSGDWERTGLFTSIIPVSGGEKPQGSRDWSAHPESKAGGLGPAPIQPQLLLTSQLQGGWAWGLLFSEVRTASSSRWLVKTIFPAMHIEVFRGKYVVVCNCIRKLKVDLWMDGGREG